MKDQRRKERKKDRERKKICLNPFPRYVLAPIPYVQAICLHPYIETVTMISDLGIFFQHCKTTYICFKEHSFKYKINVQDMYVFASM